MLAKIKFTVHAGWGYAIPTDLTQTGGKDIYLHATQLHGCRWNELQPGDTIFISKVERDGLGFRAVDFSLDYSE